MQKISVVVPVYNAEKYLDKCLDSIIKQTYKNIEIIIINDGSTDGSQKIINKYIEKYKEKIKAYETKNNGVAQARNLGIKKITGDYFLFVDADDYIEDYLIEKLVSIIQAGKIDIVKYKMKILKNNKEEMYKGPVFNKTNGEEAFNKLCFTDRMIDTPCLYLFNTNYFKKNNFYFLADTYHEDFGLIPLTIIKAKSFISSAICGYNYIEVENSITREDDYKKTVKKANDLFTHYDNIQKSIKQMQLDSKTKENILVYYTNAILLRIKELKEEDKKQYIEKIKDKKIVNNIKNGTVKSYIKFIYYKFILI